jgi:hypothetical protein
MGEAQCRCGHQIIERRAGAAQQADIGPGAGQSEQLAAPVEPEGMAGITGVVGAAVGTEIDRRRGTISTCSPDPSAAAVFDRSRSAPPQVSGLTPKDRVRSWQAAFPFQRGGRLPDRCCGVTVSSWANPRVQARSALSST